MPDEQTENRKVKYIFGKEKPKLKGKARPKKAHYSGKIESRRQKHRSKAGQKAIGQELRAKGSFGKGAAQSKVALRGMMTLTEFLAQRIPHEETKMTTKAEGDLCHGSMSDW